MESFDGKGDPTGAWIYTGCVRRFEIKYAIQAGFIMSSRLRGITTCIAIGMLTVIVRSMLR